MFDFYGGIAMQDDQEPNITSIYQKGLLLTDRYFRACFPIWYGQRRGTAFWLRGKGRLYVATCRHLIDGIALGDRISVRLLEEEVFLPVLRVEYDNTGCDAAIIDVFGDSGPAVDIVEKLGLPWAKRCWIGQPVVYSGFPLSLRSVVYKGAQIPFMKSGIISAIGPHKTGYSLEPPQMTFIESINNSGFSGAPVFANFAQGFAQEANIRVIAIVSGYVYDAPIPVMSKDENGRECQSPTYYVRANSGFMYASPLRGLVDIIEKWSSETGDIGEP